MEETRRVGRSLSIFWLFIWRSLVVAILAGAAIGFVIGLVGAASGAPKSAVTAITPVAGLLVGIIWSVHATGMALRKNYRTFRIILVRG